MKITLLATVAALAVTPLVAHAQDTTGTMGKTDQMGHMKKNKWHGHRSNKMEETQDQLQAEAKISMDSAKAIALSAMPGAEFKSSELEREHGHLIYSFDMTSGTKGVEEVNVDALTGKIRDKHHESGKAERKEAREEHRDSTKPY